jgi:hypothetical protein
MGRVLKRTAGSGAAVARYCDHAEHNEDVAREWILDAAQQCRDDALLLASAMSVDIVEVYIVRLTGLERDHPLALPGGFRADLATTDEPTWRDLQRLQAEHDRAFHPDVFGLSRCDQLRHYALHVAKLTGALADACDDDQARQRFRTLRLADLFLFGLKLSTVMGESLPTTPVLAKDA